jgi:phage terminase large subunit
MPTLADPVYTEQVQTYLAVRPYWRRDPVQYVKDRFGATATAQQVQILQAIAPPGAKVTVRSGHGIGKTTAAAWIVLWHLEIYDYAKVPCTAPSSHQLRDILWTELSKWLRHADAASEKRGDHPSLSLSQLFHWTQDRLYDLAAPDWAATARTARPDHPEALQGFHAQHLLYVIDEASGVAEEIYQAAAGSLSTPGARVLMLGNPTRTSGTFYTSHHSDRASYTPFHFRSQDSPLVDAGYRDRLVRQWGEGSNVVRVRSDGDFPRQEDDVLISLEYTEPCTTRDPATGEGVRTLGVDVAWTGADRTALVLRQGSVVDQIKVVAGHDPMRVTGDIVAVLQPWRVDIVCIDVIGLGAGTYARLRELRREGQFTCRVVAVNVSERTPRAAFLDPSQPRPHRLRDFLWLAVRQWLHEAAPVFCAPDAQANQDLAGELASTKYTINSEGHLVVEPKDAMRRRLGRSPDLGDSLGSDAK